jgi:hypothetical protein
MNRFFGNSVSVLVLTFFTGLAILATVQLAGRLTGGGSAQARVATGAAAARTSNGTSRAQDQGATSQDSGTYPDGSGTYPDSSGTSSGDSGGYYPQDSGSGTQGSTGETLTCPATGCTASTCHATQ